MMRYVSPLRCVAILAWCLGLAAPASVLAQGPAASPIPLKDNAEFLKVFEPVVAQPSKSTVEVRCKGKGVAFGTVVKNDGAILTLLSELDGPITIRMGDGKEFEAKVIAEHNQFNLALLRIDTEGLTAVQWKQSKDAGVGSWAVSAGASRKLPIAVGVVSVPLRKLPVSKDTKPLPANDQGFLGVNLDPTAKNVRIEQVVPNQGAAKGGMKAGDIIIGVAGKEVTDGESMRKILQEFKVGKIVDVKVKRDEKEIDLKITLGPRPMSNNEKQNLMGSKLSKVKSGFPVILQHDSVVKPEECGGPLVDLEGKAIGINVARAGRTESYAIPTEAVLPLLDEMYAGKHAPKGKDVEKTGTQK